MNDQIKYVAHLKLHKCGRQLEVASFHRGQLVNVKEFTKDDFLKNIVPIGQNAFIQLKNKTFYLILNSDDGTHIASGRGLARITRLSKRSKIKIGTGDLVLTLHFAKVIKAKKKERSLPIGVYLLLSFLLQFWVLNYCFSESQNTSPQIPGDGHDCTFGAIIERESNLSASQLNRRGGTLSTTEQSDPIFSPYRDLDDAVLSASLKSIQISGEISHREIRRVFDVYEDSIKICKTQYPNHSHSVSFTIHSANKIQRENNATDFSNCAFQTISQMIFPTSEDEKPVDVRIRL